MNAQWFMPNSMLSVVLSVLGMYATVLVFARVSGVRSFAQMSTFDIAVTIALGSLIATVVAAKKPPLLQGVLAMVTLYALQLTVSRLRSKFRPFELTTDNRPILLMGPGGEPKYANMRVARVTDDDLRAHLRAANVSKRSAVQAMVMEGTGKVNVLFGEDSLDYDGWIMQNVRDYTSSETER